MNDDDKTIDKVAELIGAVALVAALAATCWLCCAATGYHWE